MRLTRFTPEARIVTCMSVSVVPGAKPNTRIPFPSVSSAIARVSIASPALAAQ